MKKLLNSRFALVLIAVACILSLSFSQLSFRAMRVDLTENKAYTLSDGSKALLSQLQDEVELELFFSATQTQEIPAIRDYAKRVRELIEEYVALSNGKLSLIHTDPEPFSENEDRAAAANLTAVQASAGGAEIYLGLLAKGANSQPQNVPFFHPGREAQLEYDISQAIYLASREQSPKIGIITDLSVEGGMDFMAGINSEPWMAVEQLKSLYDVRVLPGSSTEIAEDIDLLMVIHPKDWSAQTRYAIDQYLMRGGNLAVFVDPHAEVDDLAIVSGQGSSSTLPQLFDALSLQYDPKAFISDGDLALAIRDPQSGRATRMLAWYGLQKSEFGEGPILSELQTINLASAGYFEVKESDLEVIKLLQSSPNSAADDVIKLQEQLNPKVLFDGFAPTGSPFSYALMVKGIVNSGFDQAPEASEDQEAEDSTEQAPSNQIEIEHLNKSQKAVSVFLMADVDWLSDRLWIDVQDLFGQRIGRPFADNGKLLANIGGSMSGDASLLNINQRVVEDRRFDRVQAIQAEAEFKFREKEKELLSKLEATESKLLELQRPADEGIALSLSPEQQETLLAFQNEKLETRKALRNVQHQLGKDIEQLGNRIKLFHIGLWPLLVGLGLWLLRRRLRH